MNTPATAPDNCGCDACRALAALYSPDSPILRLYRRKLLVRGWAGRPTPEEKAYILAHAPWAQGAAERGRENLARMRAAHVYNPHEQTASDGRALPEDLEQKTEVLI